MNFRKSSLLIFSLAIIGLLAVLYMIYSPRSVATLKLDTTELEVRVLLENLVIPWDMDWSKDGWIWFSEKQGRINRFLPESGPLQEVHFIEEVHQSADSSGLHALALHPEFPAVPYVYVHYTYSPDRSRLTRFTFNSSDILLEDRTILLDEIPASSNYNGSRLVFSSDQQKLFLALGHARKSHLAQDLNVHSGKILRMNIDGSIPRDNPFPDSLIWTSGHRNPQGLAMADNGILYSSEHGSSKDDELNLIEKGKNYGHPDVRGFCDSEEEAAYCDQHAVTVPLTAWTPTLGVAGIEYYDHEAIPEWRNSILMATLKSYRKEGGRRLLVLGLNNEGNKIVDINEYFMNTFGRLREVMAAPDGRIFLFTSNREHNTKPPRFPNLTDDKLIMLKNVRHTVPDS
jgi:glucose/arabinose dehydrogenase